MEYSVYKLEQITNDFTYSKLCDIFFKLAKDDTSKKVLEQILYDGGIGEYSISTKLKRKDNPHIEGVRRISIAYLYLNDPESFKYTVENKINVFHGTNANALPGILKYGIQSGRSLEEKNIDVTTGEEWSRIAGNRPFVSFTDVFEIAQEYSILNPKDKNSLFNFPIVIGTTEEEINKHRVRGIKSDVSEIIIEDSLNLDSIKCIYVPIDKVELVKQLVIDSNIEVLGMSNLDNKFYYTESFHYLVYNEELLNNYLNKQVKKNKFSEEEMLDLAKTRNIFSIRKIIEKIKYLFTNKEREYERTR